MKPKPHLFTVSVRNGGGTKRHAELCLLSAWAQRRPDSCEFRIVKKPHTPRRWRTTIFTMNPKKQPRRKSNVPLMELVKHLKSMGYIKKDEAEGMVLRAFKWKAHNGHWVPPYNERIMFKTLEALRVSGEPCFLSDTANGRFNEIVCNEAQKAKQKVS